MGFCFLRQIERGDRIGMKGQRLGYVKNNDYPLLHNYPRADLTPLDKCQQWGSTTQAGQSTLESGEEQGRKDREDHFVFRLSPLQDSGE
jgi:hypothetical protein